MEMIVIFLVSVNQQVL